MLRGKGFVALLTVTAVVAWGAWTTLERDPPMPEVGQLLFPDLLAAVNDVRQVQVTSGGESFPLERSESGWIAPSRGGYPVQGDAMHNLVVGAAGLTRLQPKTGKPERFEELGLRDPTLEESRGVGFEFKDGAGKTLVNFIVGETRPAKGDATRNEYFVRVPGEERSWLVLGTLPDDAGDVQVWLSPRIATLPGERIAEVRLVHPDGEVVTAVKREPKALDYNYKELPEGYELDGLYKINDVGRLLTDLDLDDVRPAAEVPPAPAEQVVEAITETLDGVRIRMRVQGSKEQPAAFLSAEFDPALVRRFAAGEGPEDLLDEAAARAEVETLNARWKPWAFQIPGFKYDYARRKRSELVKKSEEAKAPS